MSVVKFVFPVVCCLFSFVMGDDLEEMKNEVWGKLAQLTGEEFEESCVLG